MSMGWVAAGTRGRGLLRRRLGSDGARRLASSGSLSETVGVLAHTPYGHDVRPGMDLPTAQHAVSATLLWHLRVLAGWGPPLSATYLRVLAGGFEIANVTMHLAGLAGSASGRPPGFPDGPPYVLGALATAWPQVSPARTPADVRHALAASAWGDPEATDPASVRLALQIAWARRVAEAVPDAAESATSYAALVFARVLAAGALPALGPSVVRGVRLLLGPRCAAATSVGELSRCLPRRTARVLRDVGSVDDLWRAEARWRTLLEVDGSAAAGSAHPGVGSVVGVVKLLAVDAWRVRGALEFAARGGRQVAEVADVVA